MPSVFGGIFRVNWNMAEWFDMFRSIVPEIRVFSAVFVRMLSMHVLEHFYLVADEWISKLMG